MPLVPSHHASPRHTSTPTSPLYARATNTTTPHVPSHHHSPPRQNGHAGLATLHTRHQCLSSPRTTTHLVTRPRRPCNATNVPQTLPRPSSHRTTTPTLGTQLRLPRYATHATPMSPRIFHTRTTSHRDTTPLLT
ncbi:hypothetical protein Pcinc_008521 [Petrolisthes cinctipes]|uniref:Uncharacterized protein n=1 Tax=Petrolisthes cinctipes TaxID=88211 RepID=A0AAE1G8W0_PETCI|nr:hypothetical protein Pcinc_008521 [Petrolisthes cinctipes]